MVKELGKKVIAQNKSARHDYFIEEVYECGLVLTGTEVKSLRAGRASLTDGYAIEGLALPNIAVWKGDQVVTAISAASIIAKVTRDRIMREMEIQYPGYGFAGHKGYITASHTAALLEKGVTPIHRKSFSNIAALL